MKLRFVGCLLAASLFAGGAHAATLLNGSFESPAIQGNGYAYNVTGGDWTFAGGSGITRNNTAWGFADAPDGVQVAFLQNVSSISQTVTGLVVGQKYRLTFDLSIRPNYDLNTVTASFDGTDLASYTPATSWTGQMTHFTATSTSGLLNFSTNMAGGDHDSGLDNVRIAAVPESSTWAMMIVGFGAVGGAMRGRRKGAAKLA